jgi:hypothetical protein
MTTIVMMVMTTNAKVDEYVQGELESKLEFLLFSSLFVSYTSLIYYLPI